MPGAIWSGFIIRKFECIGLHTSRMAVIGQRDLIIDCPFRVSKRPHARCFYRKLTTAIPREGDTQIGLNIFDRRLTDRPYVALHIMQRSGASLLTPGGLLGCENGTSQFLIASCKNGWSGKSLFHSLLRGNPFAIKLILFLFNASPMTQ
jgi:hypothetical protein